MLPGRTKAMPDLNLNKVSYLFSFHCLFSFILVWVDTLRIFLHATGHYQTYFQTISKS